MQSITEKDLAHFDPLHTRKKMLTFLGISSATYCRMLRRGDGVREIRLSPGRVAYRQSDIEAFIEARATGAHAATSRGSDALGWTNARQMAA
jgi:predicted DNA-binding transcriptional regulator AlpA